MKARATLASVVVLLALTAAIVGIAASPALAANCGGGQGQALLLGCDFNSSTSRTLVSSSTADPVFQIQGSVTGVGFAASAGQTGVSGSGGTTGVNGVGDTYGVEGFGKPGTGMYGHTSSTAGGAMGVEGVIDSSSTGSYSAGVRGINNGTAGQGVGVYGSQAGSGWGVYGETPIGVGVVGYSSGGVGVQASGATALQVLGKATFSNAGTAVIASGTKSVTVSVSGVTTSDLVLATVQGSGPFYVKNAAAASGQITININKAPTSPRTVTVAYFVLN